MAVFQDSGKSGRYFPIGSDKDNLRSWSEKQNASSRELLASRSRPEAGLGCTLDVPFRVGPTACT